MKRRKFLTVTGLASGGVIAHATSESVNPEIRKHERGDAYYGTVTETQTQYHLQYDAFPNPVVKRISYDYRLVQKPIDDPTVFNAFDTQETTVKISKSKYSPRQNLSTRTSVLGFHPVFTNTTDPMINPEKSLSEDVIPYRINNKLLGAMQFVQNHEYKKDFNSTNKSTYIRQPTETLIDGIGDCKDKAILFKALANGLGYEVGYAVFTNHVAPVLRKETIPSELLPAPKTTFTVNGTDYIIIEVVEDEKQIGELVKTRNNLIVTYTGTFTPFNIEKASDHVTETLRIMQNN